MTDIPTSPSKGELDPNKANILFFVCKFSRRIYVWFVIQVVVKNIIVRAQVQRRVLHISRLISDFEIKIIWLKNN